MTLLLAVRGNIATRSMSGPPFALQRHRSTVWCRATALPQRMRELRKITSLYLGPCKLSKSLIVNFRLIHRELDFIQLRGITNRVNEAFAQCTGDFYHVGLLLGHGKMEMLPQLPAHQGQRIRK